MAETGYSFWKIGLVLKLFVLNNSSPNPEFDDTKISAIVNELTSFQPNHQGKLLALLPYLPEVIQSHVVTPLLEIYAPIKSSSNNHREILDTFAVEHKKHLLFFFPSIISLIQKTTIDYGLSMFEMTDLEAEHIFGFMVKAMIVSKKKHPAGRFFRDMLSYFKLETFERLLEQILLLTAPNLLTPANMPSQPQNSNVVPSTEKSSVVASASLESNSNNNRQAKKKQRSYSSSMQPESSQPKSQIKYGNHGVQPELLSVAHCNMRVYEILAGTLIYWLSKFKPIANGDIFQEKSPNENFEQLLVGLNFPGQMIDKKLHNSHPKQFFDSMPIVLRWSLNCYAVAINTGQTGIGIWKLFRSVTNSIWRLDQTSKPDYWDDENLTKTVLKAAAMVAIRLFIMFASGTRNQRPIGDLGRNDETLMIFHETDPVCPNCGYLTDTPEDLFLYRKVFCCEDCGIPRLCYQHEVNIRLDHKKLAQAMFPIWKEHLKKWMDQMQHQPKEKEKETTYLTTLLEFVCNAPNSAFANKLTTIHD